VPGTALSAVLAPGTALSAVFVLGAVGCSGGSGGGSGARSPVPATDVRSYLSAIQAVRLPVNALLEKADPITEAYREKKITPVQAARRMGSLETTFASYLLKVQQIQPANPQLAAIHRPYANTYFYEDAYLATLAADLREGDFDNLPDTQSQQRLAIVIWRTKVEMIAADSGVTLPADIQQAGRGEIAPESPEGPPSGRTSTHAGNS
jgi:hypothetical protein